MPPRYLARVVGWLADFFRLAWGLLYWNARKTLFQLGRGRTRCPCQSPSDSGRALATTCDACLHWAKPARFKRVCPLLVETPDGLRCSVDTADVRPFWGLTGRYYGGTLAALYVAGVLAVFGFLRIVGYPISIVHVAWPGLWHRVPQARGWFFVERANRAFAAGRTAEGLLFLINAFEFDPGNYAVGLTIARHYQLLQPNTSDRFYERLLNTFPAQRDATAQDWYRALLARGDFVQAARLSRTQVIADAARAGVWMRALLFTTRQIGDDALLDELLADSAPEARPWRQLLAVEKLLRTGRTAEARTALGRPWPGQAPPYTFYYQAGALAGLGDTFAALDVLGRAEASLGQTARYTLQLDILAAAEARGVLLRDVEKLLGQPLRGTDFLPTITLLCAHLVRHPDAEILAKLTLRLRHERMDFNNDTAGVWFSLVCAAGAVGDQDRMHTVVLQLKEASKSSFAALDTVEAFFRGDGGARRATSFLPVLPLPLEVAYAMIERYPGAPLATPASKP
ncbi:MAG: hypothetical protein HZA93_03025 [Verrucomicrobia bacterium]|nr:hypothetical protein [Verrucomicrobiota bacterium]